MRINCIQQNIGLCKNNSYKNYNSINFKNRYYANYPKEDEQQKRKNPFAYILEFFTGKNETSPNDEGANSEIIRLQQETIERNEKHSDVNFSTSKQKNRQLPILQEENTSDESVKKEVPQSSTIRTAKIKKQNQVDNAKKITVPLPNFSFNYPQLIRDLKDIDKVDVAWVEKKTQSTINIFNALSRGNGISQDAIDECYLSPQSKANAINQLLNKKENFLYEAQKQYTFEKQQYCTTLLNHINGGKSQEEIVDALDKLSQYGENSDIEKILFYYIKQDEPVILGINKVVDKLGKKGDDFWIYGYLTRNSYKLSCDTYAQLLKTTKKLIEKPYGRDEFNELTRNLLEKIPDDKTGEFTEALVELLTTAGKKEYISVLDKYLINFSYVNKFMNQGQKTPQSIIDVIDKVRVGLENKK